MGMDNRKTSGGSFVAALVFFVMTASIAIFLLLTALVVWLSEVTGSFILSSLIVGGFFAVLAAVIYLLAIREGVERIRDQVETVYDVARAAKEGYEWLDRQVFTVYEAARNAQMKRAAHWCRPFRI